MDIEDPWIRKIFDEIKRTPHLFGERVVPLKKRKEPDSGLVEPKDIDEPIPDTNACNYLLSFAQHYLGDQPDDVLWAAANDVWLVLKNHQIDRKEEEIAKLFNVTTIPDATFHRLLSVCLPTPPPPPLQCTTNTAYSLEASEQKEKSDSSESEEKESDDLDAVWRPHKLLSLESLAFPEGSFLSRGGKVIVTNASIEITPQGHWEFHVSPPLNPKLPPVNLFRIDAMPDWAQSAFKGMNCLDVIPTKLYQTALLTKENILLCAPTGSGERDVAILTILHQIASSSGDDPMNHKIVYLAPTEARVKDLVRNLSARLQHYPVQVKDITLLDHIITTCQHTQILVATPEKWDILVSRGSAYATTTKLVKLLIVDHIHLLHDDGRGPVLEAILARTVREASTSKEHTRLVASSAPLPNYRDIASFLKVDQEKGLFYFDNSYKPCPLAQLYCEPVVKHPLQRFQVMDDVCYQKAIAAAGKNQILIFVHSTKETVRTARWILDSALAQNALGRFLQEDSPSREVLNSHAAVVRNRDLKDLFPYGFAVHHAGLGTEDSQLVENLFAEGHLQVLVSTADLAWGAHLSSHTVIVKGTHILSPLDVMQMLGCAGRPQRDSYGEGIVLTGILEAHYYVALMNEQRPIESQLVSKLPSRLKAEICHGTVQNAKEACDWIGYTYLYIRMLRNPTLYGLSPEDLTTDRALEKRKADLIHSAATILDKNNLIKYDRKNGNFEVI